MHNSFPPRYHRQNWVKCWLHSLTDLCERILGVAVLEACSPPTAKSRPPESESLNSEAAALLCVLPCLVWNFWCKGALENWCSRALHPGPSSGWLRRKLPAHELLTLRAAAMHFQAGFRDDTHILVVLDIYRIYNLPVFCGWLMSSHCFNVDLCNS